MRNTDNLPYAARIEELINRTNQLNFTKSRVAPGSIPEYLIKPENDTYSVFVWDKYGLGLASSKDARHYEPALLARAGNELAKLTKRVLAQTRNDSARPSS